MPHATGALKSGAVYRLSADTFFPFYLEMYMFKSKFASEAHAERVWLHVVIHYL